jgi:hypothetical protein
MECVATLNLHTVKAYIKNGEGKISKMEGVLNGKFATGWPSCRCLRCYAQVGK